MKNISKEFWCKALETLRKYTNWEMGMYNWGIDFTNTPVAALAEELTFLMNGGDLEFSYDSKMEFDWIIEYTTNVEFERIYKEYARYGKIWDLSVPENLYDFIVFMNEHGWED